ncbi:MAG: mechanosensitive ion channel family protein, partial [Pseudomonadota bacterium]
KLLREATHVAGLKDGFVQVRELGDFSIVYRVAGLLEDVKSLISARSRLREAMLDALHDGGIEIVSPNFMTTRALDPQRSVIPVTKRRQPDPARTQGEDVAFDKAEDAASVESLRKDLQKLEAALLAANGKAAVDTDDDARAALQTRRDALRARLAEAEALIRAKADDD